MVVGSRARRTRLLVVALVALSLLTVTLDYRQGTTGPLEVLGKTALAVITPLQEAVTKVTNPAADFFSGLAHLPSLQQENRKLKAQLDATRQEMIKTADYEAKIQTLEDLLALRESLNPETVAAVVVGNSVSDFEWSITIDKGSSAGVQPGMPVVASTGGTSVPGMTGALVGRVVRVTPYSADVMLTIDPESKVGARVFTSGVTGLVEGRGTGDLQMTQIPANASVRLDDVVSTVWWSYGNLQNRYPPGIVIGRVSRVLQDTGDMDKFVTVRPAVDFSSLEFVLIVKTAGTQ